jgi:general L-amino acid transport system substrate-binding protein
MFDSRFRIPASDAVGHWLMTECELRYAHIVKVADLTRQGFASCAAWLIASALWSSSPPALSATTHRVADIQARDTLNCGIWPYVQGFAIERGGEFVGFDVDICRAVAAAILGDATKVRFTTVASVGEFADGQDIDVAVRRLTWTLPREITGKVAFGPITFYDGQGFLVPKNNGIRSADQLFGQRVCVIDLERYAEHLHNYVQDSGHTVQIVLVENDREAEEALRANRCRAYSADFSWLAAARATFVDGTRRYAILADQISKEPLAPIVRADDTELLQVVRWTIFAMIEAEELGLNSRNIGNPPSSSSQLRSFLGIHPHVPVALGAGEWVRAIIAGVGNYGEVFDRNVGAGSSLKLDRGLNRLWNRGGLMYSPPLDH